MLATDGDGREFAFDVLPSEVISGADVLQVLRGAERSRAASAAPINLRSARPLDGCRASALSMSAEGEYNDLSENDGYKVSGVFSNTFADDSMGLDGHGHLPGH